MNNNNKKNLSVSPDGYKKRQHKGMYMTNAYRKEVSQSLGDSAVYLLLFYYENCHSKKINLMNNKQVASCIGWSESKVKRYKAKLTKAKYIKFLQQSTKNYINRIYLFTEEVIDKHMERIKSNKPIELNVTVTSKESLDEPLSFLDKSILMMGHTLED